MEAKNVKLPWRVLERVSAEVLGHPFLQVISSFSVNVSKTFCRSFLCLFLRIEKISISAQPDHLLKEITIDKQTYMMYMNITLLCPLMDGNTHTHTYIHLYIHLYKKRKRETNSVRLNTFTLKSSKVTASLIS